MGGSLDGVRILDLTCGIAGPLAMMVLAEQGADVVKVEPPGGDPFRRYVGYHVWNRSRRSVTVDLGTGDGRDLFLRLLETADVLAESFSPGTMAGWRLDYPSLAERFGRLVYLSIAAYPPGTRHEHRPGYEALVHARSGLQYEQPGWRFGPTYLAMPVASMGAMFLAAVGVATALNAREETGRGQHVSTSLYQGALCFTTMYWHYADAAPPTFHLPMGKSYPPGVHQGSIYECANGEWVHAATMNGLVPKKSMAEILGLPPGPDMLTLFSMPPEERQRIDDDLRAAARQWDRDELVRALHDNDLGGEPVLPPGEGLRHPELAANGGVARVEDPDLGPTTQVGIPLWLDSTPGAVKGPQPRPGEHNDEVFSELGCSSDELAKLSALGVI